MVTDEQWAKMEHLFPALPQAGSRGRPRASHRACFEGILWVLRTGARWRDLPERFPSGSTCWRRLQQWEETGVWLRVWRALLGLLDTRGLLDWHEAFLDGSFAPAKKGGPPSGRPNAARARSAWYWSTARVSHVEASWRLPRPRKSPSPTRRSRR